MPFLPSLMRSLVLGLLLYGTGASAEGTLRDFTSDGCSLFPDGSMGDPGKWCDCCYRHDISYWQGGTEAERLEADSRLRACVRERTGSAALANLMFDGVRFGGHPVFPNWYRWGYGWSYGRGYAALSAAERQQIAEKLGRYQQDHPGGYCTRHPSR